MKKILQLVLMFFTIVSFAQTPAQRFNFENNLQNTANNLTMTGVNITYEAGRNAAAGQAMVINNNNAVLGNLATESYINHTLTGIVPTTGFSFCFWAKVNASTKVFTEERFITIGAQSPGNSGGITFFHSRNGATQTRFTAQTNTVSHGQKILSTGTSPAGWQHYAYVYDGIGTTAKMYINGIEETSVNNVTLSLANQVLRIGVQWDAVQPSQNNFSMDELMLFNIPITANQVMQIYSPSTAPTIVVGNSLVSSTTATLNYFVNANNATTASSVDYRIGNGAATTVNATSATGTTAVLRTIQLTGLSPSTTYNYVINASNISGAATTSPTVLTFTTSATAAPLYHYPFNGNTTEANDAGPAFNLLGATNTISYPNGTSILLEKNASNQTGVLQANLIGIPQGASARTISIRISFESGALATANTVFAYGANTNNGGLAADQTASNSGIYFGGTQAANFGTGVNFGTWNTFTFVYNGTTMLIYQNGNQIHSSARSLNTSGTTFKLGSNIDGSFNFCNARIDDLRIYNTALAPSEIIALNAAILSTEGFSKNNLKFKMFPNPANNLLNIDMANEIQSVEIYSLQGQKVLSSIDKQINIANLSSGMYMVRIQDVDGSVATQKLVKE